MHPSLHRQIETDLHIVPSASALLCILTNQPIPDQLSEVGFSNSLAHLTFYPLTYLHYVQHKLAVDLTAQRHKLFSMLSPSASTQRSTLERTEHILCKSDHLLQGAHSLPYVIDALIRMPTGKPAVKRLIVGMIADSTTSSTRGWKACALTNLPGLGHSTQSKPQKAPLVRTCNSLFRKPAHKTTQQTPHELKLSFNLNLTDSQKKARDAVPLPYEHQGQPQPSAPNLPDQTGVSAGITYVPDWQDDLDSDDPDDDLDI